MAEISIIIPIYNVEKYLRQCIDSVTNQTFKDIEIICVNDCSTDGSLEILEECASKDNRIRIINNSINSGYVYTVQKGLTSATGKYIMFLDSDDWYELNAFETAYNQIEKNHDDIVYYGFKFYYESENRFEIATNRLKPFLSKFEEGVSFSPKDLNIPFMSYGEIWYKIYSHDFLKRNNLQFTGHYNFAGDIPFSVTALAKAKTISVINKPLINYRMRGDTSNSIFNKNNYKDLMFNRQITYKNIMELNDEYYTKWYLVAHIRSIAWYYAKWSNANFRIKKDFYKLVHNEFKKLREKHNIEEIKEYINYREFLKFADRNVFYMFFLWFIGQIFSITNDGNHSHKVLTILGIKIKFKKHQSC